MESSERVMTEGGDAEEEYVLRLRALLHDLVRKKGRIEAAKELGLDPRTVGACMDGEGMSWRVREALEMGLQEGAGSAAARQRKRNDALERRMEIQSATRTGSSPRTSAQSPTAASTGRGRQTR